MSHESQLSPLQPRVHTLHIPGGSKFVSHVVQLGQAHPLRQELQSPAGPEFVSQVSQETFVQPWSHVSQCDPAQPILQVSH